MIQEKIDADIETVQEKVLKELKMNGLVLKDKRTGTKNGQFPLCQFPYLLTRTEVSEKILL